MTFNPHLEVLPPQQQQLWKKLQSHATPLHPLGFYLAGGTALALQVGHRQSLDFDFFSQQHSVAEPVLKWLRGFPDPLVRETDADTVHADMAGVKVSFIGDYKYPLIAECMTIEKISVAGILDIALMKLLAITHRATVRDYLDLAIIIRNHVPLPKLLETCPRKYGAHFNVMIPLKALVSFQDLDQEMPVLLDMKLGSSWQETLTRAVKEVAG